MRGALKVRIATPSQIGRRVGLAVVVENGKLAFLEIANRRNVRGIDDLGARPLHLADERVHKLVDGVVETAIFAHNSKARAFEPRWVEKFRVVGEQLATTVSSHRILRIAASHGAEKNGDIAHRARHWTRRVLTVRDRNDAAATHNSNRSFNPPQAFPATRPANGSARLHPPPAT